MLRRPQYGQSEKDACIDFITLILWISNFSYIGSWTRGYTKLKTNISERICSLCNVVEDEIHLLVNCKWYDVERSHFLGKVMTKIQIVIELNDADNFILLMSSTETQIAVWTGKCIYKSFNICLVLCFVYLLYPGGQYDTQTWRLLWCGICRRWRHRRLSYNDSIRCCRWRRDSSRFAEYVIHSLINNPY